VKPDIDYLRQWVGKSETRSDTVTPGPIAGLSATLDRDDPAPTTGDSLPPLWSWLFFLPMHRQSELARDGHAVRGGFLPPVPLSHRMIAGGRLQFHRALRVGNRISRTSSIINVTDKAGRTGPLVFVVVRHEIRDDAGIAIVEEQDIVYRDQPKGETNAMPAQKSPGAATWQREICPDPVMLFRYSALTFNGHRIHYDRPYATDVEGYPGLVVHGPFIATLLLDLVRRNLPQGTVTSFTFRSIKPIFDGAPFMVCGRLGSVEHHGSVEDSDKSIRLWAHNEQSQLVMDATATLA
jgi:3-methylfumaryl-CoA hydratase